MPTAAERQALAFLAGVALLGGGARVWMQQRDGGGAETSARASISSETVGGQLSAIDSARSNRRGKKRGSKIPTESERLNAGSSSARTTRRTRSEVDRAVVIDVDVASADELELLPRIGPALAARIVANRDSLGPFGSLEALGEVRGIGPGMLKALTPVVTFSARPRASTGRRPR